MDDLRAYKLNVVSQQFGKTFTRQSTPTWKKVHWFACVQLKNKAYEKWLAGKKQF